MASRRVPESPGLRARTARGGVVNAAFLSGAELLVLFQGLLATALLGPDAIGLYGIVTTTAMTIVALRRVGIDEAFVQTSADDEEAEFQRALTVELGLGVLGALAVAALAPVLAAAYDDDRLLGLTLAVTYLPVAFALQAPQWVFFKRMEYVRLRLLQVIVPLGTVAVAVPLLLAGVGVWSLVIGPFVGNLAAILAAWRSSPYKLRLRPDRAAARRYLRFSWPVFVTAVVALVVAQGQIAVFGLEDGLVAAGYITLAATLTRYADRADQILATTIYPAIVRVRDRVDVLEELFEKANRLTLMWAFPFGAGLALFGPDLIVFVLGDDWRGAIVLLGGLAVAVALQQVGYSWFAFYRARGRVLAAGGRVGSARRVVRAAGRAGRAALGVVGVRGRADRLHAVRPGRALGLRAAAAAGRATAARGGAGLRAGGARHGARAGPAIGSVGRRTAALAGGAGAGDLAGRARVGDLALRADPAGRAARVPGSEGHAPVAGGRADQRLHAAPLPRPARRGRADAGRLADGGGPAAVARLLLGLRARPTARRPRCSGTRCCPGASCGSARTPRPPCWCGRSSATPSPRWALRRGSRRRSRPRSRPARTRPPRRWPSPSPPCCARRRAAPRGRAGSRRSPRSGARTWG